MQLTPLGLVLILARVTAIMFIPIVGGALAGLIVDRVAATTPAGFLVGFGLGNLIAVVGIALLIRSGQRKLRRASSDAGDPAMEALDGRRAS
jgi:F0F1-type ATP synthase assembly protein I